MAMPTEAGRYIARPLDWTIGNSKNALPQAVIRFALLQRLNGTDWQDVTADGLELQGYFNLVYVKDGSQTLNEINIKQIRDSIGWVGGVEDFIAADFSAVECQVVLEFEDYNGKQELRLKYLNPRDWEGGMKKSTPDEVKNLEMQYGAMLRTVSGTKAATPANGNSKPASNPVATPVRTPAASSAAPLPIKADTKEGAWKALTSKVEAFNREQPDAAYSREKVQETFKHILTDLFKGKDLKALTPLEWKTATEAITADFCAATGDLLPY